MHEAITYNSLEARMKMGRMLSYKDPVHNSLHMSIH